MAPGAGPAALLAALDGLGEQVAELRLPLPVAGAEPARRLQPRDRRPARRLRAPAAAPAGRPAARRGRWPDRCRQVDAGQQPGRQAGQRLRGAAADDPLGRPRLPPERQRVVRGGAHPARAEAHHRRARPTPSTIQLVPSEGIPAGLAVLDAPDIDSVVTRNRDAGDPAAGRRGHVAVRHDGRALRRRRALGVPADGRHPRHRRGGRPRPGPAGGDRGGARAPGQHADRARPR